MQEKITIINVKRSTQKLKFQQTIFLSAWLNNESRLRQEGWLPKNDIEKVEYEEVNDGLELDEVIIEEEKEFDGVDYSEYTLAELKAACDEKNIKYHHASKENKLISLLEA